MKPAIQLAILSTFASLAGGVSAADATLLFRADAKTVTTPGAGFYGTARAARLFLDNSFSLAAPVGTAIWFVADQNKDGVPASRLGSSLVALNTVLGDDDVVIYRDVLDGGQPGVLGGQYRQTGIQVFGAPEDLARLQNANIYVYLWNASGVDFTPAEGVSFGIQNLGVQPAPALGNAFWGIAENISASQFTVVALQQPLTGQVAMQGFDGTSRKVSFSATDGLTVTNRTVQTLSFLGGVASFTLPVPPGTLRVSAKTSWNLRKSLPVSFSFGSAVVNFTGVNFLLAGDIDGSNQVDMGDYVALAAMWYSSPAVAADLDGNGRVDLDDYFILANNWYLPGGDPE